MPDEALQRTVRRCTAFVVIPLSVLVIQVNQLAAYDEEVHPVLTVLIPGVFVVGASGYLVLSALQIDRPADDAVQPVEEDGETDDAAETA
ncbi:hypothetical protein [Halosimplex sp. J119]